MNSDQITINYHQTMVATIQTKLLPPTNTRGYRIKAWCERGSMTMPPPIPNRSSSDDLNHRAAAMALCSKYALEDYKERGILQTESAWRRPFVSGVLPDGTHAHVFVE